MGSSTGAISCVTLITSEMMQNFTESPTVLFLDGTYKLNLENYCLYAVVVQDRTGVGRPVALSFMASETLDNISTFFDAFKRCHVTWDQIEVFFVDKDYTEIRAIEKQFPGCAVLLCMLHVLAYIRKHMARTFGATKAQAYANFYACVVSRSEADFDARWKDLVDEVPDEKLQEYLESNWLECREM